MNEIINVPLSGQRDLATVTAEIRAYQDAARRAVLSYCIEIGRRLVEAKSMVNHGEWGEYLKTELGFSQSTANNHMRLFEAYGADQMTLTGAAIKSQAFGNLSYTQALALLALPSEEEREEFVETHDLASMSTRELQEELRRRGDGGTGDPSPTETTAEPSRENLVGRLDDALEEIRENGVALQKAEQKVEAFRTQAESMTKTVDKYRAEIVQAQNDKAEAEKKAKAAAEDLQKAKAALDAAKRSEADALKKLNDAVKNPKVPKDVLEKLRKEAEEAAEKRHDADYVALDEAKAKYIKAEQEAARARQEAERLEKELRLAAPEVSVFRDRFSRVQGSLAELIESIGTLPEDKQEGAKNGLRAMLQKWLEELKETKAGESTEERSSAIVRRREA